MKCRIIVMFFCSASGVIADWKLSAVYNKTASTGLTLIGASRLKDDGKVAGTFVDGLIKSATQKSPIMIGYTVPVKTRVQGTLTLHLQNQQQEPYALYFESNPSNDVAFGRTKVVKNAPLGSSERCSREDGTHCARALLKKGSQVLAQAMYSYDKDGDVPSLDLTISKQSGGGYELAFTKAL